MGDIFREVDDELKQERLERLWKQYGKYAIAAAVLVVVGVGAWKFWDSQRIAERHAEGLKFSNAAALLEQGRAEDAARGFAELATGSSSGYGVLARFNEAAILAQGGNAAGAIDIYDSISADGSAPPSLKNMAIILGGIQALRVASIDNAAIERKLQPLAAPGSAYRHIALEILALSAQGAGDTEKAKTNYRAIVDDAEAPAGIRSRASQMLGILGGS